MRLRRLKWHALAALIGIVQTLVAAEPLIPPLKFTDTRLSNDTGALVLRTFSST